MIPEDHSQIIVMEDGTVLLNTEGQGIIKFNHNHLQEGQHEPSDLRTFKTENSQEKVIALF